MRFFNKNNPNINSVSFSIAFPVGSIHEPKELSGITHLIEHLSYRKTSKLVQSEIYDILETNGVFIKGVTSNVSMEFNFSCRKEVFRTIVSLLADMLCFTDYTEDDIELERQIVAQEIVAKGIGSSFKVIANRRWHNQTLKQPVLGTSETLFKITKEQIADYKKRILSSNPYVVLIGNYTEDDLHLVEELFNYGGNEIFTVEQNISVPIEDKICFNNYNSSVVDVYYSYHFTLSDKRRNEELHCLEVLDSVLFKGVKAYITETLRDKKGLLYEIDSCMFVNDNEVILLFEFTALRYAIVKVIKILEDMLNTFKMDEKYFKYHKAFICDNIEILHDNIQDYAYQIISLSIETKELMTPEKSAEQLAKISLERIDEIYQKLIETKQVYFCGRLFRRDRKELKTLIK